MDPSRIAGIPSTWQGSLECRHPRSAPLNLDTGPSRTASAQQNQQPTQQQGGAPQHGSLFFESIQSSQLPPDPSGSRSHPTSATPDPLPNYEALASAEASSSDPNLRFGRWRGRIEKRAQERADLAYEDVQRGHARGGSQSKGWGEGGGGLGRAVSERHAQAERRMLEAGAVKAGLVPLIAEEEDSGVEPCSNHPPGEKSGSPPGLPPRHTRSSDMAVDAHPLTASTVLSPVGSRFARHVLEKPLCSVTLSAGVGASASERLAPGWVVGVWRNRKRQLTGAGPMTSQVCSRGYCTRPVRDRPAPRPLRRPTLPLPAHLPRTSPGPAHLGRPRRPPALPARGAFQAQSCQPAWRSPRPGPHTGGRDRWRAEDVEPRNAHEPGKVALPQPRRPADRPRPCLTRQGQFLQHATPRPGFSWRVLQGPGREQQHQGVWPSRLLAAGGRRYT